MKRLMIVDDEVLSIEYICSLIDWQKEGYEIVAEMHSVKQAMSVLETLTVDIVIFDVSMPGLNGVDLSRYIKERHPEVSMLAISGFDNYDYVHEILMNGACDYILKHRLTKEVLLNVLSRINAGITRKGPFPTIGRFSLMGGDQQTTLLDAIEKRDWRAFEEVIQEVLQEGEEWRGAAQELFQLLLIAFQRNGDKILPNSTNKLLEIITNGTRANVVQAFVAFAQGQYCIADVPAYSHYVQAAIDFIVDNYMLNISLNDCANVIGVNASYLSRIFHQETGEQFTRRLNAVRLSKAKEMIIEDTPLKQVAYNCGFKDYSYFFKVFRKENGCTPQKYAESKKVKKTQ
ncbi:MAG: response regulator [Sphaerochaetaceae bacterium]|jgi:YesN/AraC family two-component response regulator